MTPSPLWSKREVADYLGISTRQVDRLVEKRRLNFVLVESRRRFRECDVLFYIASRSFGHRPDSPASTI